MIVALPFPATFDDLMKVEGKAELINGRIVEQMASGDVPSLVGFNIAIHLRSFVRLHNLGRVYPDNVGCALSVELLSGRQSFAPDVTFVTGAPAPNRMRFLEGAPTFAVEVRSECDYGRAAEIAMSAKRDDYFEAGTLVVWDVDPIARTVTKFTPTRNVIFTGNEVADAEPAVPGWTMPVADIFAES